MTVDEGRVIDQRFRLGRVIRESRVAVVYEAKHRNGAEAWIKLPRGPEHSAAITAEAQVANALGANAVNIRDDGVSEQGLPYLVLEPVQGQRADHWVQHCGGRAPPQEAIGLGDELCQAIGTMHRAGYAIGVLRAESIIVAKPGGMCLVELEHTRPATDASVLEDIALVGRLVYELLCGERFAADAPTLVARMPDLPRAMVTTVDDAAQGRFTSLEALRTALLSSVPQWLGPVRRPMPSLSPDVEAPLEFSEIVLPRSSKLLFDPAELVDSSRSRDLAAAAGVAPSSSGGDLWAQSSGQSRSSTTAIDAPPIAAGPRSVAERPRGSRRFLLAGALGSVVLLGGVAAVVGFSLAARKGQAVATSRVEATTTPVPAAPPPPVPKVAAAEPKTAPVAAEAPPPVVAPAVPAVASAAPVARAPVAGVNAKETKLRFEGDLSPRLVIVDGIRIGTTVKPDIHYACGMRTVKIGGKGVARQIELPCGGEQVIVVEQNGAWKPR